MSSGVGSSPTRGTYETIYQQTTSLVELPKTQRETQYLEAGQINMEEKRPDNVVWSKEHGYNSSLLPYTTNIGAPAISLEDVAGWKSKGVTKTNREFSARYEELKAAYAQLIEEYQWNDLVYRAQYSFEPVIGETYYLYLRKSGEAFLSLISPREWKQPTYLGAFRLESTLKWEKVPDSEN